MITKECNKKDLMMQLFVVIDDLMMQFPVLLWTWKGVWRPPNMVASEVITCVVFGLITWFKTTKHLYWDLASYHNDDFNLPHYKNFNEAVNRYSKDALILLQMIICNNRMNSIWKNMFIDATSVAVCHNKRIFDHKVCDWVAQRGKSTMWRFFWFKVHMIVDEAWNPLSFAITPWNTDDRKPVKKMVRKLTGILIADAGYVSEELRNDLAEMGITFLSNYKKNMKVLVTTWFHKMMKLRQIVETWFGMMKCWWNLVSSYARSVGGHLARIVHNLLGYGIKKLLSNAPLAIS